MVIYVTTLESHDANSATLTRSIIKICLETLWVR